MATVAGQFRFSASLLRRLFRMVVTPRFLSLMALLVLLIVFSGFALRYQVAGVVPCELQSRTHTLSAAQLSA
jgi:hypothetical protein